MGSPPAYNRFLRAIYYGQAVASLFLILPTPLHASAISEPNSLCSLPPRSYATAKQNYPEFADAINYLETQGIATWYSDREISENATESAQQLVETCSPSSTLSVVVYGLPNKDCEAGYSATNSWVQTSDDYALFIDSLTSIIGDRKVLYILEPDAVGLIAHGKCAIESNYTENLVVAIDKLTQTNPNAEIYLDVGFWTLSNSTKAAAVAKILQGFAEGGRGQVKGITLNTSNYQPTNNMTQLCTTFHDASSDSDSNTC